jgi:hypothetical protein
MNGDTKYIRPAGQNDDEMQQGATTGIILPVPRPLHSTVVLDLQFALLQTPLHEYTPPVPHPCETVHEGVDSIHSAAVHSGPVTN